MISAIDFQPFTDQPHWITTKDGKHILIGGSKVPSLQDHAPKIASIAQKVYDDWDESNTDEYAGGGICHLIADEIASYLISKHIEAATVSAQIGEQHVWVVAKLKDGVYSVDIPPSVYETGGGYSWQKIPDVTITKHDVIIDKIDANPNHFDQYLDYAEYRDWEEEKHPRHPAGTKEGGEFAPKGSIDHFEHEGATGGTQGAQWYRDPATGKRFVVKGMTYKDSDRVATEVLAANVYNLLGVPVPNIFEATLNGKRVSVSEELVGAKLKDSIEGDTQLQKGFMTDAFVANWDVVGLEFDNILYKSGIPFRADLGGTFTYRAQGGSKPYGPKPLEMKSLLDSNLNPQSAQAFGSIPTSELKAQAAHIASVMTDAKIASLVSSAKFAKKSTADAVIAGMKGRRDWMQAFAKTGKFSIDAAEYAAVEWVEEEHPRAPKGSKAPHGGQWIPKPGMTNAGTREPPILSALQGHLSDYTISTSLIKNPSITDYKANEIMKEYRAWMKQMSQYEMDMFRQYSGIYYSDINNCLRGKGTECDRKPWVGSNVSITKAGDIIAAELDKTELPAPLTVYREMSVKAHERAEFTPGRIFADKAFTSTTLRPDVSLGMGYANNIKFVISLPRGARAAYLNGMVEHPQEAEVLINRGARFQITHVDPKPNDRDQTVVHLKLL